MTMITEITQAQQLFMIEAAHARMDELVNADSNAWMTAEYIELENLVANLFNAA
jgi:hypothetical protein